MGGRIEDDLVECKTDWPDPQKAARRLAAHANGARGQEIVWIVGLDEERHCVHRVSDDEVASWWDQVRRHFDEEICPRVEVLRVPTSPEHSVTSLFFATDRSPYVVTKGGEQGGFDRDVPYREGNRTRSAHRHELLRMLSAAAMPPQIEVVWCRLASHSSTASGGTDDLLFTIEGNVFFDTPTSGQLVALAKHRMKGTLHFGATSSSGVELEPLPLAELELHHEIVRYQQAEGTFRSAVAMDAVYEEPHPAGVDSRTGAIYIAGPGALYLEARATLPGRLRIALAEVREVELRLLLPVSGGDRPAMCSAVLSRRAGDQWTYRALGE